ncbi:MAG: hypothetical protein JO354_07385 [Verrucomicrobia bacterium]|nr:hypothetical protein [Verrucomicrobiota bacterium]
MKTISTTDRFAGFTDAGHGPGRQFPFINAHFHGDMAGNSFAGTPAYRSELRRFRKLSGHFLEKETPRDYVREIALFGVIVAVSAWPIVSMVHALMQMLR